MDLVELKGEDLIAMFEQALAKYEKNKPASSFLQVSGEQHNCEYHFHFYSLSALHIYDLYHMHINTITIEFKSDDATKLWVLFDCSEQPIGKMFTRKTLTL